jgi:acyl-CoA thioesterase-1
MDRRSFIYSNLTLLTLSDIFSRFSRPGSQKVLPKVLILGDSISIGYTPFVKEMMLGIAEVFRPELEDGTPENCAGTTKGVMELNRWLGDTKWNVIHFNFGLHDLKHIDPDTGENSMNPKDPQQAPLKQYKKNLSQIVDRLLETGAHLIFATTTPYPNPVDGPLRKPGQAQKYNDAALKIVEKQDIQVNDLYSFVKPQMETLMLKKNVHFNEDGSKALAEEVVRLIKPVVMKNP